MSHKDLFLYRLQQALGISIPWIADIAPNESMISFSDSLMIKEWEEEENWIVAKPSFGSLNGWEGIIVPVLTVDERTKKLILYLFEELIAAEEGRGADDFPFSYEKEAVKWIQGGKAAPTALLMEWQSIYPDSEKITPVLLYNTDTDATSSTDRSEEIKALLQSFFGRGVILLKLSPLEILLLLHPEMVEEGEDHPLLSLEAVGQAVAEVLLTELSFGCKLSIDFPVPWQTIPEAYASCRRQLKWGQNHKPSLAVYHPKALWLHRTVDRLGAETYAEWRSRLAALFEALQEEEVLTMIKAFIDNDGRLAETARALFIHRNTLIYRLDKFKNETGWDLRQLEEVFVIQLALLIMPPST
jgi:hypothetical protein